MQPTEVAQLRGKSHSDRICAAGHWHHSVGVLAYYLLARAYESEAWVQKKPLQSCGSNRFTERLCRPNQPGAAF